MIKYRGPERRVHKVYVTRNTEYHTRARVCVGVRDRISGSWIPAHVAMHKPLCGSLMFKNGSIMPNTGAPKAGESLYFHDDRNDVVTSTLMSVERPTQSIVTQYVGRR